MRQLCFAAIVALVCGGATAARAAEVGTGSIVVHQDLATTNQACVQITFPNAVHNVFGTDVNMGTAAGGLVCTGLGDGFGNVTGSCASYPTAGAFSFDTVASSICDSAPCNVGSVVSFVSTSFTNVAGTVPAAIGDASYVFDGAVTAGNGGFLGSSTIPGCPIVGAVVVSTGNFGLNAFQNAHTSTGSDVTVSTTTDFYNPLTGTTQPVEVSANFANVGGDGTTTITASSSASPTVTSNFAVSVGGYQAVFFDVRTTASYSGPITICGSYPDDDDDGFLDPDNTVPETLLRALHEEGGVFVDRTSSLNTGTNMLCATVSSLSYFVFAVGTPPDNDDCSTATEVDAVPYSDSIDTTVAAGDGSDPTLDCGSADQGNNTVWYTYTADADGTIIIDTIGSDYNTVLAVWGGSCGALTPISCDDDSGGSGASRIVLDVTTGNTYLIEVSSYSAGGGTLVLNVNSPPANDDCSSPTEIDTLPYHDDVDTTSASTDGSDPIFDCVSGQKHRSVWYSYTATADGLLQVDSADSDYDTVLAVYSGSCGALTSLNCDDDGGSGVTSMLEVPVTAGSTYLIEAASYDSESGTLGLNVSLFTPFPNDECSGPTGITLPYSEPGLDTTDATSGIDDPVSDCSDSTSHSVWYSFTAASAGILTVSTEGSDYDTVVSVYSGDCDALTEVGCNDDGGPGGISIAQVQVNCGKTYLIEVSGYGSDSGTLVLDAQLDTSTFCPAYPANCTGSQKNSLALSKDPSDTAKRKLSWKWLKGTAAISLSDFGNPVSGCSSYHLCVYDETALTPSLRFEATVPAGGTCGGKPCWKAVSDKGFSFKSKDGATSSGITKLSLKSGSIGKGKIQLGGKGSSLPLSAPVSGSEFFDQDNAVLVQLYNASNSICFETSYSAAGTKKNDGTAFKGTNK